MLKCCAIISLDISWLFNLPLQMKRCPAIKRKVSCCVLWHKFPSYQCKEVWKRWRVWHTTRAAKCFVLPGTPLHLAALRHVAEMADVQPAGVFFPCWGYSGLLWRSAPGAVLTSGVNQGMLSGGVTRPVTLGCCCPERHHECLPPQHLPQWPGNHSSHHATALPHKSTSENCAFKRWI